MRRILSPVACLATIPLVLLLAGCVGDPPLPRHSGDPVVAPLKAAHTVRFAAMSGALTDGERLSLVRFLAKSGLVIGDRVRVEQAADGDSLAAARRAAIIDELTQAGLRAEAMAGGADARDAIDVAVERSVAKAPGCPNWRDPGIFEAPVERAKNGPPSNYGCATAANLAQEIARPADLLVGETPDATRAPAFRSQTTINAPVVSTVAAPSTSGSSGTGASSGGAQ
jgi:pilus assembly protein CpaD